jgi:glycerol-3-phosphate dehydrogenase subunit C
MSNLEPTDPMYVDEVSVRMELARAFDVCSSCRRCVDLCPTFPAMFELVDRFADRDAGRLTPGEQDDVMEQCYHCTRCTDGCPFIDGGVTAGGVPVAPLDVAALALRAAAMRRAAGHVTLRQRMASAAVGRALLPGGRGAVVRSAAAGAATGPPGSLGRRMVAATTGWSSERLVPPRARQRFSTWWRRHRDRAGGAADRGVDSGPPVQLFPTCIVEYHAPEVGRAAVEVYARDGVRCDVVGAGCCGAPALDAGNVDAFVRAARATVDALREPAHAGRPIVVAQSTCAYVIREHYPRHVPGDDTDAVADAVVDLTADLAARVRDGRLRLPPAPGGEHVVVHSSCRGGPDASATADLLRAAGTEVSVVRSCSGIGGEWGYRSAHVAASVDQGRTLVDAIDRTGSERAPTVVGGCHLSNCAIGELGSAPGRHLVELLAEWGADERSAAPPD